MKLANCVRRAGAIALALALTGVGGCQKKEGPAETAGKKIDQAVEKAGENVERAGEKIQDAAQGDKGKK
jgi:hypothetical protein